MGKASDRARRVLMAAGKAALAAAPVLARDGALYVGAGLVSYGVWLIHRPSGFIVAGLQLIVGALVAARAAVKARA